jgi:hypothetical protein
MPCPNARLARLRHPAGKWLTRHVLLKAHRRAPTTTACEMYLLADPGAGTPRERYARLLVLHEAGRNDLLARGLDDAHAWLPPPIARRFGSRLEALGWIRDDAWTPYCRRLRDGASGK